jgi:Ni,Fe-hydrogenase I large subunit
VNLDGELSVRVGLEQREDGMRVTHTALRCTRPHLASGIFSGHAVQDVVSMVPRLFSVCGQAQGVASALACEAAAGSTAEPAVTEARRLLVGVELVQEGLLRTLIDWPRMMGDEPAAQRLGSARAALGATLSAISGAPGFMPPPPDNETVAASGRRARAVAADVVARQVLGVPHTIWEGLRTPEDLGAWSESSDTPAAKLVGGLQNSDGILGACTVALMPRVNGEAARIFAQAIEADPAFARLPRWMGAPAETGPLARMHAHPLIAAAVARFGRSALARFVARLGELCAFASGALPELGSRGVGTGRGIAWVETARGLLLHHAVVNDGRIQRYRIVAPTEWNFHPEGALVRGLEGRAFAHEGAVLRAVALLVQSLDPCVAWKLELSHA